MHFNPRRTTGRSSTSRARARARESLTLVNFNPPGGINREFISSSPSGTIPREILLIRATLNKSLNDREIFTSELCTARNRARGGFLGVYLKEYM